MPDPIVPQNPPQTVVVETVRPNPRAVHTAHLDRLKNAVAGMQLNMTGIKDVKSPTPSKAPVAKITEEGVHVDPIAEPARQEEKASVEGEVGGEMGEGQPPATTTDAATEPSKPETRSQDLQRRQRSLDIQKRADAAAKRAKEVAAKAGEDRKAAERRVLEAEELAKQVKSREHQIASLEREYGAKLDLLKTNPLEFARQHGVTGNEVAQFVKDGADPTKLEIKQLKEQFSRALNSVRDEAKAQVEAIKSSVLADKAADAHRNFFDYVDDALKTNPEQFQALDVVYSQKELWDKANELAEKSDRLNLGWSSDRLLEELETEAQKDSRWSKIKSRLSPVTKTTPKESPKTSPNTQEIDKSIEEVRPNRPARERNDYGQFQGRPMTPTERHKAHVAKIANSVRFTR